VEQDAQSFEVVRSVQRRDEQDQPRVVGHTILLSEYA